MTDPGPQLAPQAGSSVVPSYGELGERGRRTAAGTAADFALFGAMVLAYQDSHPNTIVHVRFQASRYLALGSIIVTWWPRGEVPER